MYVAMYIWVGKIYVDLKSLLMADWSMYLCKEYNFAVFYKNIFLSPVYISPFDGFHE